MHCGDQDGEEVRKEGDKCTKRLIHFAVEQYCKATIFQ